MHLTDRIAAKFGISPAEREQTVGGMLASGRGTSGGYWLQLLTAMFIATLGLVLGSTAVVIGAMLVSPLMTPIINLGMGLAIGSPVLVVRSAIRFAASSAVVVGGAAVVVLVLPVREVTSEISSRTSPTALDLAIASCCAVAGIYAAVRAGSDTTSTAAGTAIGIALVPPLCVVGFGLGIGIGRIAAGAALLFTANFCAIVLVSVLGFLLFGFGSVPVAALERAHAEAFEPTRLSGRIARRLNMFFASRASRVVRIVMPFALVLLVFVPLRSALGEVAWEVRVRSAVQEALRGVAAETVQSQVRIEDHKVSVRIVVIGNAETARRIRSSLHERIDRVAPKTKVSVEVLAVPDSDALARAESAARDTPVAPLPGAPVWSAARPVMAARDELEHVLEAWPAEACGPLLAWNVAFPRDAAEMTVTVVHVGAPLGPAASDVLSRAIERAGGDRARINDVALSPVPIEHDVGRGAEWLVSVARELTRAGDVGARVEAPFACIALPERGESIDVAASVLRQHPRASITSRSGERWSFRWSTSPCPAGDAGADGVDGGGAGDGGERD